MNPIAMVEVGVAWRGDHTWQIMQVYIPSNTPEDKIAETAIALAIKADGSNAIASAWLAHYTYEDFLFAQEEDAPASRYMTVEEYLANRGVECPVCRSANIEAESVSPDGPTASGVVTCNDCESTWVDVYELISYEQLSDNSYSTDEELSEEDQERLDRFYEELERRQEDGEPLTCASCNKVIDPGESADPCFRCGAPLCFYCSTSGPRCRGCEDLP